MSVTNGWKMFLQWAAPLRSLLAHRAIKETVVFFCRYADVIHVRHRGALDGQCGRTYGLGTYMRSHNVSRADVLLDEIVQQFCTQLLYDLIIQ